MSPLTSVNHGQLIAKNDQKLNGQTKKDPNVFKTCCLIILQHTMLGVLHNFAMNGCWSRHCRFKSNADSRVLYHTLLLQTNWMRRMKLVYGLKLLHLLISAIEFIGMKVMMSTSLDEWLERIIPCHHCKLAWKLVHGFKLQTSMCRARGRGTRQQKRLLQQRGMHAAINRISL